MTDRSVRVRLSLTHSDFSRGLAVVGAETSAFAKQLDTADNSFSRLIQTGIALGPSLVPVMGAVAAGGIGVAEALGATALGAGVAVLAFQGVGDALKAVNDYALDPTEAHLEKVHQTMAAIGPDGQRFVMMLQDLRPELQGLQDTAREGLLPGVTEGLERLLDAGPDIESLVSNIAQALGGVAADAGGALSSPFWTDFLDFLATDGRDSMVTMLQIIGQLTKASASLVMAFHPLSSDIGNSLLDRAEEFAHWSEELDKTQGFQDFVEFVERVGPEVWDTLGSIGEALVEITKAAAPVGEVSLPIIKAIAETLSAIASSPVGPVLIGVAAGINAIARAIAIYNVASGSAFGTLLFGKAGTGGGLLGANVSRQQAAIRGTAGAIGILALSLTDLDEAAGLSNTANFGLLGFAIGGPIGGAIGGLIGLTKDLATSTDDLDAALRNLDETVSRTPFDPTARAEALKDLQQAITGFQASADPSGLAALSPANAFAKNFDFFKTGTDFLLGPGNQWDDNRDKIIEGLEAEHDAIVANLGLNQGIIEFNRALGSANPDNFFATVAPPETLGTDLESIQAAAERVVPALEAAGYSVDEINNLLTTHEGWDAALKAASAYVETSDSVKGRTDSLIGSVQALDSRLISTTSSAEAFANALDELLNPQMSLEAATDAYTTALRHWEDELAKNSKTLKGNSDAAIQNRASLRGRVELLKDQLKAEAEAGWGSERLTNSMRRERQALLDAGDAAGLNRGEMRELLKTYNLTPRLIQTLIKANTESALQDISKLKAYLASLHDKTINITTIQHTAASQQAAYRARGNAYGGQVFGPGGPRDDMVPRMLSNREWVQPVDAVDYYGPGFMSAVQHKTFPRMADGGSVAWFADGTPRGSRMTMPYTARTSVPGDARGGGPVVISGRLILDGDNAYIRGVIRDEIDGDAAFASAAARQRGR